MFRYNLEENMLDRRNPISASSLLASGIMLGLLGCAPAGNADPFASDDGAESSVKAIRNPTGVATAYPEAVLITMDNGWICSGSVIAPRVVLTAGHCVDGHNSFSITAPYATGSDGQPQTRYASGKWTEYQSVSEFVNPNVPDLGLLFVDTPFTMPDWPTVSDRTHYGEQATNVGRINNGTSSYSNLYVGSSLTLTSMYGYPYSYGYSSAGVTQPGDSGGPMFLAGTHTIVAVCSGGGVAGRTESVYSQIDQLVQSHGGWGSQTTAPPTEPPPDPGPVCQYTCEQVGFTEGDCGVDQYDQHWKCDGTCLNQVASCSSETPETPTSGPIDTQTLETWSAFEVVAGALNCRQTAYTGSVVHVFQNGTLLEPTSTYAPRVVTDSRGKPWLRVFGEGTSTACYVSASYEYIRPVY
jgi:Trypsin